MTKNNAAGLIPTTNKISELSRAWAKVSSIGDGVEDTSGSVATVER